MKLTIAASVLLALAGCASQPHVLCVGAHASPGDTVDSGLRRFRVTEVYGTSEVCRAAPLYPVLAKGDVL